MLKSLKKLFLNTTVGCNMENKYYTPNIEEFHLGFRYEYLDDLYKNVWFPTSISNLGQFESISPIEEIRVKFLNLQDIESLGWSDYKKSISNWYYIKGFFTLKNGLKYRAFRLLHCHDINTVKITGFEYEHQINEETEFEDLFYGECKNYNELKYIIDKLGIPSIP